MPHPLLLNASSTSFIILSLLPPPMLSVSIPTCTSSPGRDVIGRAKTGSGKTAAFAVPILQELALDPFGIFALVLTPTRELAFQIADQFKALGLPLSLETAVVVGGLGMCITLTRHLNYPTSFVFFIFFICLFIYLFSHLTFHISRIPYLSHQPHLISPRLALPLIIFCFFFLVFYSPPTLPVCLRQT